MAQADQQSNTDPIYSAIAEYREARAHFEGLTGSDSWGSKFWKADEAERTAWSRLIETVPTTEAGWQALTIYVAEFAPDHYPPFVEVFQSYARQNPRAGSIPAFLVAV